MLRMLIKDKQGRVAPIISKTRSITSGDKYCRKIIQTAAWERFDNIPLEDIEVEYSVIRYSGNVLEAIA